MTTDAHQLETPKRLNCGSFHKLVSELQKHDWRCCAIAWVGLKNGRTAVVYIDLLNIRISVMDGSYLLPTSTKLPEQLASHIVAQARIALVDVVRIQFQRKCFAKIDIGRNNGEPLKRA
jgi:hypothetical protein